MYIKQVGAGVRRAHGPREAGCPGATRGWVRAGRGVGGGEERGAGRAERRAAAGASLGARCVERSSGPGAVGCRQRRPGLLGRRGLLRARGGWGGCGRPRRSAGMAVPGPRGPGWAAGFSPPCLRLCPRRADPRGRTRRACSLGCLLLSKWSSRARGHLRNEPLCTRSARRRFSIRGGRL